MKMLLFGSHMIIEFCVRDAYIILGKSAKMLRYESQLMNNETQTRKGYIYLSIQQTCL